jgi:Na+/H+ antiporter NhaC
MDNTQSKNQYDMKGWAFLPFILLIAMPIANMIYNQVAGLSQSENYLPTLAICTVPTIFAFFYGKGTVKQKTDAFCKALANDSIMMVVLIFILAGTFSQVSKDMGGVESVVNLCLSFLPANLAYAGIFFISSLISVSIGTSVGTVTAMAAVAYGLVMQVGLDPNVGLSAVVGGAVFGDNLSMVSDTTIAAVKGFGCEMSDKFKMNLLIVLPAFVLTLLIYVFMGSNATGGSIEVGSYNLLKIVPYLLIIVLSLIGMDTILVMCSGIFASAVLGLIFGNFNLVTLVRSVSTGVSGMSTVTFSILIVTGLMGIIKFHGGLDWLLDKATLKLKSQRGAEYTSALLSTILAFLLAGTSAIVIAAPLVRPINEKYGIESRRSASIVSMFATASTALVFWAGLTIIATGLAGAGDAFTMVKMAFYPFLVYLCGIISIQFRLYPGSRAAKQREKDILATDATAAEE